MDNKNDLVKWMAVILSPLLVFVLFFFYVDNPAARGGRMWVEYKGEESSCYLRFDFCGDWYLRHYVENSLSLSVRPVHDSRTSVFFPDPKIENGSLFFRYSDLAVTKRNNSSSLVTDLETLDRCVEYEGRLQGNHDGIIFNRREKDVIFYFTIEDSKPERSPESVIFASPQEYYCDGVYATVFDGDDHPSALNIDLGERFNREFFEISFEYYILPEDGPRASSGVLFSLGREYEILHVSWDSDGYLNIVLNNGDDIYGTAIKSVPGRWMRLDLCYDRGRLFVNGLSFDVETISDKGIEGDNILSSVNYSTGRCFKGHIRNLEVKSDREAIPLIKKAPQPTKRMSPQPVPHPAESSSGKAIDYRI